MENSDAPGVRGEPGGHRASGRGRDSPDAHFFFADDWVVSCGGKDVSRRRDSARGRRELMSRMETKQGRFHTMSLIDS